MTNTTDNRWADRDPITGVQRSPPTGTPAGAGQGNTAHSAADEAFNASVHDVYWREAHAREPYYNSRYTYDDYAPGYRTGYELADRYRGRNMKFDDLEPELQAQYERIKGKSQLAWAEAKFAARAAWRRVEEFLPGDLDNDGR